MRLIVEYAQRVMFFLRKIEIFDKDDFCPDGWSVKRRPDSSAQTCEMIDKTKKCPKPYMCMNSQCGLSFCCANDSK